MAGKRKNPDYHQLCVYVPKHLAVKFKTICTSKELEQSEVITSFITKWLEEIENEDIKNDT